MSKRKMGKKKMIKKKMAKKKIVGRKPVKKSTNRKRPVDAPDNSLRQHVLYLLGGGGAHISFEDALQDWPVELTAAKVSNFPHTAWMLLEHMRLAQWDILEFSRNPRHVSPAWPEGYWPETEGPANEKAWKDSIAEFKRDLDAMEKLVSNPKVDLHAKLPWGDGQTILREALLLADHNAYHLGQLVMLRKCMGI